MTEREFSGALSVLGATGLLAVVVPSFDRLWQANPDDAAVRAQLNLAHTVYLGAAVLIVILGTAVYRSAWVFVLGAILIGTRILTERVALNTFMPSGSSADEDE